ncbi:MAG TPA: hypothetical protein VJT84_12975 [Gaiellaceae bacterium]|nr:hypothetical protein [Gaiellaceae bacterium]
MNRLPSAASASNVFVAEHYLAGVDFRGAQTLLTRLVRASGGHLRHALFLPADETFLAVYDGSSANSVRAATAAAAPTHSSLDRVVGALLLDPYREENR